MLVGLLGKLVMHTLTRFAFTLTQLLVWGYMFGACVAANAQAQKPLYTPGPSIATRENFHSITGV
jgi:hypothetical protein